MAAPAEQCLTLKNRIQRPLRSQPISYGVPWPQGAVQEASALCARDAHDRPLPAAFTVLNRWPDGSAQWTLVDLALDFDPVQTQRVRIESAKEERPTPKNPAHVEIENGEARIGNGLVELVLSDRPGKLLREWEAAGQQIVEPGGFDVSFTGAGGVLFSLSAGPRTLSIEHQNPLRSVLRIDGKHASADGETLLDYYLRVEMRAGREDVKLTYAFRNLEEVTPGVEIEAMKAHFRTCAPEEASRCFTANNVGRHYFNTYMRIEEDPTIVASDTGDLDRYAETHEEGARADTFVRDRSVLHDPPEGKPWFLRNPRFRLQAGGNRCAWPYLALAGEKGGVLGAFEQMVSLHPKSLTSEGSTLRFGIWPDWAGPLSIRQGAGRSHVIHLAPLGPDATDEDIQNRYLSWELGGVHTHVPPKATVVIEPDVEHVRRCGVFAMDKLPPYDPERNMVFERKVRDAWIGITYGQLGATDKAEPPRGRGFWDYGDNGANNEEMFGLVYFQNYLRSGDWDCAEVGLAMARHIMEVDHVAYSTDEFQNGGMVSHCLHHNDGAAYPSHMWFTELLFAYALTGDVEYRKAALRLCENLLHWVESDVGFSILTADGREAGQPMINLTWCYRFNRDERYLQACSRIIREGLMERAKRYGHMLCPKPPNMPVKAVRYGDYASYEGMFWYWELTDDDEVRDFMLEQLDWRLQPQKMGIHGFHRTTDYNPAAYAYYMSGDESWLTRVQRPFRAAFHCAKWPLGWIHSMYYIKLAFERGIIEDGDVIAQ